MYFGGLSRTYSLWPCVLWRMLPSGVCCGAEFKNYKGFGITCCLHVGTHCQSTQLWWCVTWHCSVKPVPFEALIRSCTLHWHSFFFLSFAFLFSIHFFIWIFFSFACSPFIIVSFSSIILFWVLFRSLLHSFLRSVLLYFCIRYLTYFFSSFVALYYLERPAVFREADKMWLSERTVYLALYVYCC